MSSQPWFVSGNPCLYLTAKQMVSGKMPLFFFLLVFFSIVSYKTNPTGTRSSCLGVFPFLVPPSCVASLGGGGFSGPLGKESIPQILIISRGF